jgi:hypothetical protein
MSLDIEAAHELWRCHARCGHGAKSPYAFAGFVAKPAAQPDDGKCKIYFSWRGTVLPDEWLADANVRHAVAWINTKPGYLLRCGTARKLSFTDVSPGGPGGFHC